ncbi:MAG: alpha/beta fold hydrolase [Sandaracinobacteroides sp.]
MPTLTLSDGCPLWYSDEGRGPALVMLQGLQFPSGYFWQKVTPELAKTNRVITIDLRGQGLSGKSAGRHSIRENADDLEDALGQLGLDHILLLGVAYGGMVALTYLKQHGAHRLRALCLSEMTARLTNAEGWDHPTFGDFPAEAGAGFAAGVRADRTAALGGFLLASFANTPDPATLAEMTAQTWLTPTETVATLIEDMVRQDYRADLSGITLPTLLVYGRSGNPVMPGEIGRWMQSRISGSELVELPGAGHSPFWDDPAGFTAAIADFAART